MSVNLRQLVKESTLEVLQEDLTAPVNEGEGFQNLKRLVIAGVLLWATLTHDGRSAVKQAYKALQLNTAVPQQVQQQIQDEVPYTGVELDKFIQAQIEHRDNVEKEIAPISKKIFKSKYFVRDEEPTKEGLSKLKDRVEYKINGAGDVYRKTGDKVECWYRGQWVSTIFKDSWDMNVLKPISPEQAQIAITKKQQELGEGFDPTSAGPNPEATEGTQNNPYPQWNAEMRKMEEETPTRTEQGQCPECGNEKCNCKLVQRVQAYSDLKKKVESGQASPEEVQKLAAEKPWIQSILRQAGYGVQGHGMGLRESDPHGRYAQDAGAGQFDPRTFGVNEYICTPCKTGNHKFCNRRDFRNRCCCQQS